LRVIDAVGRRIDRPAVVRRYRAVVVVVVHVVLKAGRSPL
jgi:hypothetical protein